MTTKEYHKKQIGVFDLKKIDNLKDLKNNINQNTEGHSTKYIFTLSLNSFNRTTALSKALNEMTKSLRDRFSTRETIFKTEVEKELREFIVQLTGIVERYHNSKTFRNQVIFKPDIHKFKKEIGKAYEMIKIIEKLNNQIEEKENIFLN